MLATTAVDVPSPLRHSGQSARQHRGRRLARPGDALHLLWHLQRRVPQRYCFSVNDSLRRVPGTGYRWDNCSTAHTGRPRPQPAGGRSNRFRNRFSHKFWYYPDKYDSLLRSLRLLHHALPDAHRHQEVLRTMGSPAGRRRPSRWRRWPRSAGRL
jgi:hypothetical protein